MQNPICKATEEVAWRFFLYSLFKRYYQGDYRQAKQIVIEVKKYLQSVVAVDRAAELAAQLSDCGTIIMDQKVEFDYNRLFIGPGKLLAPPVESAYRNPSRLIMQQETLAVRQFYSHLGMMLAVKNQIPDDHLGMELEFVCYLLVQEGNHGESDQEAAKRYRSYYQRFFVEHLKPWIYRHLDDVWNYGETSACRSAAVAMKHFFQTEELNLSAEEEIS